MAASIPEASSATVYGLGTIRFISDLLACAIVGSLFSAVAFIPNNNSRLSAQSRRAVWRTSGLAAIWTVFAALEIAFTYSDFAPLPLSQSFDLTQLSSFVSAIPQAKALWIQCCLAALLAAFAFRVKHVVTAQIALFVALVAVLPPPLTGHSSSSSNHEIAISTLSLHVIAATMWVGGVFALLMIARNHSSDFPLHRAVARFSSTALICFIAVVASGVVNALLRVHSVSSLFSTQYGFLILLKVAAALSLGIIGYRHRNISIPALENGGPNAFRRYITSEFTIMVLTFAVAVTLSRSAPPA